MKVRILKTGKVEEYEAGYAARLIEQGKAIPTPKKAEPDVAPCEGDAVQAGHHRAHHRKTGLERRNQTKARYAIRSLAGQAVSAGPEGLPQRRRADAIQPHRHGPPAFRAHGSILHR